MSHRYERLVQCEIEDAYERWNEDGVRSALAAADEVRGSRGRSVLVSSRMLCLASGLIRGVIPYLGGVERHKEHFPYLLGVNDTREQIHASLKEIITRWGRFVEEHL